MPKQNPDETTYGSRKECIMHFSYRGEPPIAPYHQYRVNLWQNPEKVTFFKGPNRNWVGELFWSTEVFVEDVLCRLAYVREKLFLIHLRGINMFQTKLVECEITWQRALLIHFWFGSILLDECSASGSKVGFRSRITRSTPHMDQKIPSGSQYLHKNNVLWIHRYGSVFYFF